MTSGLAERATAAFLRGLLRASFKPLIGPPFGVRMQRRVAAALALLMPGCRGVARTRRALPGAQALAAEVLVPEGVDEAAADTVVLYLHGGAFCLGGPATHRSLCTRLARAAAAPVWVLDYRLAPEHPYPAALHDARIAFRHLLARGGATGAPPRVVLAGDSAGGGLALALTLWLRAAAEPGPDALVLFSPVVDGSLSGASIETRAAFDPMLRRAWLAQGLAWYAAPTRADATAPGAPRDEPPAFVHHALAQALDGLPPLLIQVGEDEILRDDALRLADHARSCGVPVTLERFAGRWHVFQLQAFYLASARDALQRAGRFVRELAGPRTP